MNLRLAKGLYWTSWVVAAAVLAYFMLHDGRQRVSANLNPLQILVFIFVNRSLAYLVHAEELKLKGIEPPTFATFLSGDRDQQTVTLPRPTRILMGVVLFAGGLFFLAFAAIGVAMLDFTAFPESLGALGLTAFMAALVVTSVYAGFRLVVMKADERLFKCLKLGP